MHVLLLILVLASLAQAAHFRVARVIDGDTIEIVVDSTTQSVRYIGVDTPELSDARSDVRALARRSRDFNRRLVAGRDVRLEFDLEKTDRYGRLLAYVWVGDTLVNELLVRRGYAQVFTVPPNLRYAEQLVRAQVRARQEGLGLWNAAESADEALYLRAEEAVGHVGKAATVCGLVASARHLSRSRGEPTFLNLGNPYPNQLFTVVIWADIRRQLEVEPEDAFLKRSICTRGQIEVYSGRPQIEVRSPADLWLESERPRPD